MKVIISSDWEGKFHWELSWEVTETTNATIPNEALIKKIITLCEAQKTQYAKIMPVEPVA